MCISDFFFVDALRDHVNTDEVKQLSISYLPRFHRFHPFLFRRRARLAHVLARALGSSSVPALVK